MKDGKVTCVPHTEVCFLAPCRVFLYDRIKCNLHTCCILVLFPVRYIDDPDVFARHLAVDLRICYANSTHLPKIPNPMVVPFGENPTDLHSFIQERLKFFTKVAHLFSFAKR